MVSLSTTAIGHRRPRKFVSTREEEPAMIGSAKQKLKQNSGATILMALMLFLACVTIAGVILGSAMTNLNKVKNQQKQLQVYESVSSAARLVRDRMNGLTFTASESVLIYGCQNFAITPQMNFYPDREAAKYGYTEPAVSAGGSDALTQLIQEGVTQVYRSKLSKENLNNYQTFSSWEETFTIDDHRCKVHVTVSIDENYQLTFKFRPLDENWKDDYNVTLLMEKPTDVPSTVEQTITNQCSHTYKQHNNVTGKEETITQEFNAKKTTKTTTITYGTGTIYKGASGE